MLKKRFLNVQLADHEKYINNLCKNLVSNPKLFADDTSIFSVIFDKGLSGKKLNDDLNRINNWAFEWKLSFNPDPNKQTQEVLSSRKILKSSQPLLILTNNIVTQSLTQKNLGMFLDTNLDFQGHLKSTFSKVNDWFITEATPHIAEIAFTCNL